MLTMTGEEYGESSFGGFGDYMRRKKLKLQNQDEEIRQDIKGHGYTCTSSVHESLQ